MVRGVDFIIRDIAEYENTKIVKIGGELVLSNIDDFTKALSPYILQEGLVLILDCRELKFIDSSGNFGLFQMHYKLEQRGGRVKIFGFKKEIISVLSTLGIYDLMDIYETYEQLLDSLTK